MSKLLKVFLVSTVLFLIIFNFNSVFAIPVDLNLSANNVVSNVTNNSSNNSTTNTNTNLNNSTNTVSNTTTDSTSTTTTVSSSLGASSFDLKLTNILSIFIIVIGVLLILLGFAILIRLNKRK